MTNFLMKWISKLNNNNNLHQYSRYRIILTKIIIVTKRKMIIQINKLKIRVSWLIKYVAIITHILLLMINRLNVIDYFQLGKHNYIALQGNLILIYLNLLRLKYKITILNQILVKMYSIVRTIMIIVIKLILMEL